MAKNYDGGVNRMSKLRFGIVGCGVISKTHADVISKLSNDAELVAVCDIIEERAKELASKYGARYYTDYELMLKQDDIDVISVCTPSGLHSDMAVLAAKSKKHVIVEKPMDINLEKADAIMRAEKENNVVISIIAQHRFDNAVALFKKLSDEGRFGKIV